MIGEEKGSVAISGRSSHKMTGLFALRGGVGYGLSESVGFVDNAYWDVFFSENVSDPVIKSFCYVRDL